MTPLSMPVCSNLRQRPKHILIVDDSPYNIFVLEEILRSLDPALKILTAINGLEAVSAVFSRANFINSPDELGGFTD